MPGKQAAARRPRNAVKADKEGPTNTGSPRQRRVPEDPRRRARAMPTKMSAGLAKREAE